MYVDYLDLSHPLAWMVEDVLSPEECLAFIERMRRAPDAAVAPVTGENGEVVELEVRNNTRIIFFDADLAVELWRRISTRVPQVLMGHQVVGVNECFRIYRYGEGEHHGPHWDTQIDLPDGRSSLLTFIIYLNDGFQGGDTSFDQIGMVVKPKEGQGLLFQHRVLHDAQVVAQGEKFVLRSEVFYRAGKAEAGGV